eukprot:TRINITY_DN10582_c0_g2_i1.p1 TRINITY_DN10582_c0_g2~~TRINITY_DN10582_c0_g2_i1.p1  ORF type:complete len:1022 (+),score=268.43 TRINITY_DN10582_c0_g2_i1:51-3068(+)
MELNPLHEDQDARNIFPPAPIVAFGNGESNAEATQPTSIAAASADVQHNPAFLIPPDQQAQTTSLPEPTSLSLPDDQPTAREAPTALDNDDQGFMIPTFAATSRSGADSDEDDDPGSSDDEAESKMRRQRLASTASRLVPRMGFARLQPLASQSANKGVSDGSTMSNGDPIDFVFVIELPETRAEIVRLEEEAAASPHSSDSNAVKSCRKRQLFFYNLQSEGVRLEHHLSPDGKLQFVKACVSFERLLIEAESNNLKMTLEDKVASKIQNAMTTTATEKIAQGINWVTSRFTCLEPDVEEEPDSFSAPFRVDQLDDFLDHDKPAVFFTSAQRNDLTHTILDNIKYGKKASQKGLQKLIANGSFIAAYPLHDGMWDETGEAALNSERGNDRRLLYKNWGRLGCWYVLQPYDLIRRYFGVKIGLYFAWLGFYTLALIAPCVLGLLVFLGGLGAVNTQTDVKEICSSNITMCPVCDDGCERFQLSDSCGGYKFAFVFDNPGTVFFATFMALWATIFLDFWKRRENFLAYDWDTRDYEDLEPIRPQFRGTTKRPNPVTGKVEKHYPASKRYAKQLGSSLTVLAMIGVVCVVVISVLIYRLAVKASLYKTSGNANDASTITSVTAAILNLVAIILLTTLYKNLAVTLTEWENHRLESEYQSALTVKIFLFQFMNNYATLFYIAFFKGRFTGIPGDYSYIFGFRQDECPPDLGCMGELTLQLAIVFVGRQTINNIQEMVIPIIMRWYRKRNTGDEFDVSENALSAWERDYFLDPYPDEGMFNEYLELMLQYGYITMFVPAFSLAPMFAFLNNIFEIRVDAHKLLVDFRRPPATRAADIGVWYQVLNLIGFFAVVINAMVIAFTSNFIPRQVYYYENDSLSGYITRVTPLSPIQNSTDDLFGCHYNGWRDEDGSRGRFYFLVVAAQLAFVIVFEHFVFFAKVVIAHIIPDVPKAVQLSIKRENYLAQQALEGDLLGQAMTDRVRAVSMSMQQRSNSISLAPAGPVGPAQSAA